MSSNPGRKDFLTHQGATFSKVLQYGTKVDPNDPDEALAPIDITGYDFRMQVRDGYGASATLIFDLSVSGGEITIVDAVNGIIQLKIEDTVTEAQSAGRYKYDLEAIDPSGDVDPWIYGCFDLGPEVTV